MDSAVAIDLTDDSPRLVSRGLRRTSSHMLPRGSDERAERSTRSITEARGGVLIVDEQEDGTSSSRGGRGGRSVARRLPSSAMTSDSLSDSAAAQAAVRGVGGSHRAAMQASKRQVVNVASAPDLGALQDKTGTANSQASRETGERGKGKEPAVDMPAAACGAHADKLRISSTVSRSFTCPVCFDDVEKGGQVATFGCGHRLCFDCAGHFIGDKVKSAQVSRKQLVCPIPDCKTALAAQEVRGCLNDQPELLVKYESFTLQNFLRKSSGAPTFFCPTAGCEFAAEKAHNQQQERFECPSCSKVYCLKCDLEWHGRDSCEEAAEKRDMSPDEKKFRQIAAKKGMKKCPSCKMWVDKNKGCNAMVCVCGCTFCWVCGVDVNAKGGCDCLKNLDRLSARERQSVIEVNAHATNRDNPAHAHMQRNLHHANIGMPGGLGGAGWAAMGPGNGFAGGWAAHLDHMMAGLLDGGWGLGGGGGGWVGGGARGAGGGGGRRGARGGGGGRAGGDAWVAGFAGWGQRLGGDVRDAAGRGGRGWA